MLKVATLLSLMLFGSVGFARTTEPATLDRSSNLEGYNLESASVGDYDIAGRWYGSDFNIWTKPGLAKSEGKYAGLSTFPKVIPVQVRLIFRSPDLNTTKLIILPASLTLAYRGLTARGSIETVSMSLRLVAGHPVAAISGTYVGGSAYAGAAVGAGYKLMKNTRNSILLQNMSFGVGLGVDASKVTATLKLDPSAKATVNIYGSKITLDQYYDRFDSDITPILNHVM